MPKRTESTPEKPAMILKHFYDSYGWQTDETSGVHLAESYFQDMSETAQNYRLNHELRYRKFFEDAGEVFLDAGCGGQPRPWMSKGFQSHIRVDISVVGLKEAKKQLGDYGEHVLADMAAIPFKDAAFDGILASHCLYHIDKELQPVVLSELYRTSKNHKNILVFYSSRLNLISLIHLVPKVSVPLINRFLNLFKLHLGKAPPYLMTFSKNHSLGHDAVPPIYSYPHNPKRLTKDCLLRM